MDLRKGLEKGQPLLRPALAAERPGLLQRGKYFFRIRPLDALAQSVVADRSGECVRILDRQLLREDHGGVVIDPDQGAAEGGSDRHQLRGLLETALGDRAGS